jgi:hypothetical protein
MPPTDLASDAAFVQEAARRLPLADAALSAWAYLFSDDFLDGVFDRHRGRSFTDVLTFPVLLGLLADALVQHRGSARQSLAHADGQGQLPTCPEAFYGKLRRVPLSLSVGLLADTALRLRPLLPPLAACPLPACLKAFTVVGIDGKKLKNAAKRLKPTRGCAGRLFGGKLLVGVTLADGLAVALAADPDGEANDCRLVPRLMPRLRAAVPGCRLFVADAQFGDLTQPPLFAAAGDAFLVRFSPRTHFHPDPAVPPRPATDGAGRAIRDETGWVGGPADPRRRRVRRLTLLRPGDKDVVLMTDLIDPDAYPAADLVAVYGKRWHLERVFQQVTEVFELRRLIGSSPQATVFQGAFCLVLYNLLQVLKLRLTWTQAARLAAEQVSLELLFTDLCRQLIALRELLPLSAIRAAWSPPLAAAALAVRLDGLLKPAWTERWRKTSDARPRPKRKKGKQSGAHTSVHRLLQKPKPATDSR